MPFVLRFEGPDRVAAGEPGTRPVHGQLPPLPAPPRIPPGPALAGRDARVSAAELRYGRELWLALRQAGVAERLAAFLDRGPDVLAVDGDRAAQQATWELLALAEGPHLEETGTPVVRLGPAGPSRALEGPLSVAGWSPTPNDPTCAARLARLPTPPPGPLLLHLVCHGAAVDGLLALGDDHSPGSLSAAARSLLTRSPWVVLEVCEAGSPKSLEALPNRLVAQGVSICLGSRGRVASQALDVLGPALAGSLSRGPREAILSARAAVRALRLPRPDARWHQIQVHVSDLARLVTSPVHQDWARHAQDLKVQGIEALGLALGIPVWTLERVRRLRPIADAPPTVPPRATAWLGAPEGELRAHVHQALGEAPLPPASGSGGTTLELPLGAGDAPTAIEVLGGPDDGRVLHPVPNQTLGRWAPEGGPDLALYRDTSCFDPYLSRRHLVWQPGHITLLRPMTLRRQGVEVTHPPGDVEVQSGDLWMTPATVLRLR